MRKKGLLGRLLLPTLAVLVLLPPLSCLIFYQAAGQYAHDQAIQDLEALQQNILPLMRSSFSLDPAGSGAASGAYDAALPGAVSEQVKNFLSQVGPLLSHIGGNARLMILESRMQLIYPRDAQERTALAPLAEDFAQYIGSTGAAAGNDSFRAADGTDYLINVYEVPTRSVQIRYLIAYCPASLVGAWVGEASRLVLAISSLFTLVILAVLWLAAHSVTEPLKRLCREAGRIGDGSFGEIEPDFSLRELEELRLAMNRMSAQLMGADLSQKNFFQNVSHELRTPLMSISGYAQGIEQGIFHEPKEAARIILEESMRLTELVNRLLSLSRLESGGQQPSLGPLPIAAALEDCLDRINGLALQKGLSLVLCPFEPEIAAYGQEELFGKVLDNLLTNAVRYAKTTVSISVLQEAGYIAVRVEDDGGGIAEEDLPHVFERCYKGEGGNFGIGLAIARSAAQQMGGDLKAANRAEGGAVFTLLLKRAG